MKVAAVLMLLLVPSVAGAELTRVTINARTTVAGGAAFGQAGAYEKLTGTVEFAIDPADPHNKPIVDVALAPRGADGKVRFTSDLYVLRPVDPARANGVLLFEIANRGNKLIFNYFEGRGSDRYNDPNALEDFREGFLLKDGYTLVWVGWQFDVQPPGLRVEAPPVDMRGSPTPDTLRYSFILNSAANETREADLASYPPVEAAMSSATLTVRDRFWDAPTTLPRASWRLVPDAEALRVVLDTGFEPGRVYEITYRAQGARVAAVGLAALRDAASAFQHRTDLGISGRTAYLFGASQSGRLLRQFLLDGFNVDEQNRRVFSLAWPHIAGAGLGSFNERFAIPGFSSFPATRTPFLWTEILGKYSPQQAPKVVVTNTSVEYWGQGRSAALTHIAPDGSRDAVVPDNVRIYLLAGTQHAEGAFPPPAAGNGQQRPNPTPHVTSMRAILRAAHGWASSNAKPLDSRYPKISDGTLVPLASFTFPAIPGVADARTAEGPGEIRNGRFVPRPFLVPRVDADGNELAGIRVPEQGVPLATTTGWNFRSPRIGNPTTIIALQGSYIPLPATRAVREARHDPRQSIEERYRTKEEYLQKVGAAADALIRDGYLLQGDRERVLTRAAQHWDLATKP